jgi:hypothetical protein
MKKKLLVSLSCAIALSSAVSVMAAPDKATAPAAAPSTSAAPAAEKASKPAEVLTGKVLQTMNSGGYTYVNIQKKNGDKIWVAVMETPVKKDAQLSFKGGMEMTNFESKSLKRTFEKIVFSDGIIADSSAKATISDGQKSLGSKGSTANKDAKISVAKATGPGATTVQEAFANSAKLNKKKVVVKGKVVKVSSQIMGRNWVHIQDGTGSQAKGNHNLVCTSKGTAEIGDVVTVRGTLVKDRDFGAGYKYAVIVEDATISK